MRPLDQREELQAYYQDHRVVAEYLRRRTGQPLNGVLHRAQVRFLNRVVRTRDPLRVLEIAPGPARLTAELDFQGRGAAIDASPRMLATARARLREHPAQWLLVRGDAFELPFAAAEFDLVYTLKFIRHFQLPERQRLYAEIRRVLAPGGAFVLDAQNRAVSLPHRRRKGLEQYRIFDVLYDEGELVEELRGAGFAVVAIEGLMRHFGLQQRLNRLRRVGLGGMARRLIEIVERVPGRHPSTWMVLNEVRA
jgi:ubiquinone/menaquinone biosynthesis C-methylase UbiE